jgi:TatA/E family protein of Tat protein translocase
MSWLEWLIVLAVAAILFGPRRLGRSAGRIAGEFRGGARGERDPVGPASPAGGAPGPAERARLLAVLELPPEATPEQVQRAWRELAKVWHPDRFARDAALQARATERLAAINAAYERLTRSG